MNTIGKNWMGVFLFVLVFLPSQSFAQQGSAPPDFVTEIETVEDYERLSEAEQTVADEYIASGGPGLFAGPIVGLPDGAVSCFDHYTFGSVQVDLSPQVGSTVNGAPLTFHGTIQNENPYPIIDGAVYMKVFRIPRSGERPLNGYDVVEQRFVLEDIDLPAEATVPASFTWNVPVGLATGEYRAVFYFSSAKRFNLLGLPFTDDVGGNSVTFAVAGEIGGYVGFKKDEVVVANEPYQFTAAPKQVDQSSPIVVKAMLENSTGQEVTIPVTWTTYAWDQQRSENIVHQETQMVTIPTDSTQQLAHTVTDNSSAVYLVVAEAKYIDTKSVINVRFVRENVAVPRINFPSVTEFPLLPGEETVLFSCVHGAGTVATIEDVTLTLTLIGANNMPFYQYEYEGDVTGSMMAVADIFTPKQAYDTFTLSATLKQGGEVIEEVTVRYDCKTLGNCMAPSATTLSEDGGISIASIFVVLLVLVAVGIVLFLILQRRKFNHIEADEDDERHTSGTGSMPHFLWFVAFFFAASYLWTGTAVLAAGKSDVVSSMYNGVLFYRQTTQFGSTLNWVPGLEDPNVNVTYEASVYDHDTGVLVVDNSTVPVGTRLRFEPARGEIAWHGTGYAMDTPYGVWQTDAAWPDGGEKAVVNLAQTQIGDCSPVYFLGSASLVSGMYGIYVPLSVHPEEMSLDLSGSTAGLSPEGGNVYRITSPGTVTAEFHFDATYGQFFYEYEWIDGICRTSWDNTPMSEQPAGVSLTGYTGTISGLLLGDSGHSWTPYQHPIPATTIVYTVRTAGVEANAAPSVPVVTPDSGNSNLSGDQQRFTIVASDPGDLIRYGIDWNMDAVVDEWLPGVGYIPSDTHLPTSHAWLTGGVKTFQVLAQDDGALTSGWRSVSVTLCAADEEWDGARCIPATTAQCLGITPLHAVLYVSDQLDLVVDTQKVYSAVNTTAKCEFSCQDAYTWNAVAGTCDAPLNEPPMAFILQPAGAVTVSDGASVHFEGMGYDAVNGIAQHEWRVGNGIASCETGTLWHSDGPGSDSSFDTAALTPGVYTVYYKVKDTAGAWSTNCPSRTITVNPDENSSLVSVCDIYTNLPIAVGPGSIAARNLMNGQVENLTVHFGDNHDCSDPDITLDPATSMTDSNSPDAIDVLQNAASAFWEVTGDNGAPGTETERITVQYEGSQTYLDYTVYVTPTVSLTVNGSTVPIDVPYHGNVTLDWTTTGSVTECTASGDWAGSKAVPLGSEMISNITADQTYTIVCTGPGGTSAPATVQIRAMTPPNLLPIVGSVTPSAAFDVTTGTYHALTLAYVVRNDGEGSAGPFINQLDVDFGNDGTIDATVNPSFAGLATGDTPAQNELLAIDVPFGPYRVIVHVDSTDKIEEGDETDNIVTITNELAAPLLPMTLTIEDFVKSGDQATIHWDTKVSYPISCSLYGPQIATHNFDPSVSGPTGSLVTGPITAKSTYTLDCVESTTGAKGSTQVTVETPGRVEET
ncbi:MAG: hypothetical protein KC877_04015 [Candidatus Kaiserbacteria bacterium]|nr:hypothetical protein [Candidatus Kaiserbacteria bacterium]MCB9816344.1 hypothetical protein [Candidatus Nomurabacteria bacterium]